MKLQLQHLNDMALFAKVVEHGGFSAAARALDMQKSMVSRRINALESYLDLRLVERNTRHFKLTDTGQLYYPHCAKLVDEALNAQFTISNIQDHPQGELRVSASVTVGQALISPILSGFLEKYPDVQVNLQLSNKRIEVIDEGFDVVVRVGQLQDSTLIAKKIYEASMHLYASPSYLEQKGLVSSPEDLVHRDCIQMSDFLSPNKWNFRRAKETLSVTIKPRVLSNDFWAMRHIAEEGGGIAILPDYLDNIAPSENKLVRVLEDWQIPANDLYVLHTSRVGNTPKVRAFLDYLYSAFN